MILRDGNQFLLDKGIIENNSKLALYLLLDACTFKFLPNGNLIYNDFGSWDLVLLEQTGSNSWSEKKRITGIGAGSPGYFKFMKTRVADDDKNFLWLRGKHDLSIVDSRDFSAKHIHNFWNFRGENSNAVAVALDSQAQKVVGIGFVEGKSDIQTIHVYDGRDGVTAFEAADILEEEVSAWISLEVSLEGDKFFVGGAKNRDFSRGDAYIAALEFDENADLISYKKFGPEYGFNCFTSLRRHPEEDILFGGCFGWLVILAWAGNEFHIINKIKNIVEAPITDIDVKLAKRAVYTVCEHVQGMAVYFDKNFCQQREKFRNTTDQKALPYDYLSRNQGSNNSNDPYRSRARDVQIPVKPRSEEQNWNVSSQPYNPMKASVKDIYKMKPQQHSKYDYLYRNFKISQISVPGSKLRRVCVNKDMSRIFVSGLKLQILELQNGSYQRTNLTNHISDDIIDMKLLNDESLIVFEESCSDLIKYNRQLYEMKRIKGTRPACPSKFNP